MGRPGKGRAGRACVKREESWASRAHADRGDRWPPPFLSSATPPAGLPGANQAVHPPGVRPAAIRSDRSSAARFSRSLRMRRTDLVARSMNTCGV